MRKLSLILLLLAFIIAAAHVFSDSPHGTDFKVPCGECHSSKGWFLDKEIYSFDHNKTAFPLTGQHQVTDCRLCHISLVFSEAKDACFECHTDMHNQTVGPDCERCHTTQSWIVDNITEIHRMSRFPLVGPHYLSDCSQCHPSASLLRWEPQGIECVDCHLADYQATTSPNHVTGNYSTDCAECHLINSFTWSGTGINHDFFPLTLGHEIGDCQQCHTGGDYSGLSPECSTCHFDDYQSSTNPNHVQLEFSINCLDCHSTNPGWQPADFSQHDELYFPVYSGSHNGTWNVCSECHTSPANYAQFSCIDCHEHNKPDTDEEHNEVGGYVYESMACYECHPTGEGEGGFNHNISQFPLTGAHITTPCADCHVSGYQGTPTNCDACHIAAYNQTTSPSHTDLNLPTDCSDCHTTNPEWKPATFDIHNNYYVLQGAHASIATDCDACHQGNYSSTPNTCVGCHLEAYNQTNDPPHAAAQFPTDCETCHSQIAWTPATWDHDNLYFPIYSGKHQGEWNNCSDCHTNGSNYAIFSCIDCHEHNQPDMDDEHSGVPGYQYNSIACLECHPDGEAGKFIRSITFPKKVD